MFSDRSLCSVAIVVLACPNRYSWFPTGCIMFHMHLFVFIKGFGDHIHWRSLEDGKKEAEARYMTVIPFHLCNVVV